MKPQNLLPLLFLVIFLHFQPIKAENSIIGIWEFQHLDYNGSFLCCPFNTMTIKDNSETDSFSGKTKNFKATFDFYSDPDKRCHHLIQSTVSDGLLIFNNYGSKNQTKTMIRYYDETKGFYSYEIYFTLWNQSKTLSVEYARNWATNGKVCEYTMTRKNPTAESSAMTFFKFLPLVIIIIMGISFTFQMMKRPKVIKPQQPYVPTDKNLDTTLQVN